MIEKRKKPIALCRRKKKIKKPSSQLTNSKPLHSFPVLFCILRALFYRARVTRESLISIVISNENGNEWKGCALDDRKRKEKKRASAIDDDVRHVFLFSLFFFNLHTSKKKKKKMNLLTSRLPPLHGAGFWVAFWQVAAVYYGFAALIHWVVPAFFDVETVQVGKRRPGQVRKEALLSVGAFSFFFFFHF